MSSQLSLVVAATRMKNWATDIKGAIYNFFDYQCVAKIKDDLCTISQEQEDKEEKEIKSRGRDCFIEMKLYTYMYNRIRMKRDTFQGTIGFTWDLKSIKEEVVKKNKLVIFFEAYNGGLYKSFSNNSFLIFFPNGEYYGELQEQVDLYWAIAFLDSVLQEYKIEETTDKSLKVLRLLCKEHGLKKSQLRKYDGETESDFSDEEDVVNVSKKKKRVRKQPVRKVKRIKSD